MVTEEGDGWIGYAPPGPPFPRDRRPEPVATWRATLPTTLTSPTLVFDPALDRGALILALNELPEYMPFVWPDTTLRADADLRTLALLKVLAVVQFGAGWSSPGSVERIAEAGAEDPEFTTRTDTWLHVTGEVFPRGDAGFVIEDVPDHALRPPHILGGGDDRVILSLVSAALIRLIREQDASWDPLA